VFAFAGALILNRSFARELTNDCLDALVAAPISAPRCLPGRRSPTWPLLLGGRAGLAPVVRGVLQRAVDATVLALMLVLLLGTWGLTVVGTMFSALTVNLRLRELMLPMLLYPIMIPALLAAVELTTPW